MTTSIRILRLGMKWAEKVHRGEDKKKMEETIECFSLALCPDAVLCPSPKLSCKFPSIQVCVHACPVHLTSLNSNNVFPPINMLWISECIIDRPAQLYSYPGPLRPPLSLFTTEVSPVLNLLIEYPLSYNLSSLLFFHLIFFFFFFKQELRSAHSSYLSSCISTDQ